MKQPRNARSGADRGRKWSPLLLAPERLEERIMLAADLALVAVPGPISAQAGSVIGITWTVANQGDQATSTAWFDQVYFSTDATLDAGDDLLGGSLHAEETPLAPGASVVVQRSALLPQ